MGGGRRAAARSWRRPAQRSRGRARQWYDVTVKGRFSRQAMADIDITQAEADALIAMEKQCVDDKRLVLPGPGEQLAVSLTSLDKRESSMLDVTRAQIKLTKATYQNRARQAIILMRLDLDGPPHRNPDDKEIPCPHPHIYREGYADKWAVPAPTNIYPDPTDLFPTFEAFMRHCNITVPPYIQLELFS